MPASRSSAEPDRLSDRQAEPAGQARLIRRGRSPRKRRACTRAARPYPILDVSDAGDVQWLAPHVGAVSDSGRFVRDRYRVS